MTQVSDDPLAQRKIETIFFSDYTFAEPSERYVRLYGGVRDDITLGLAHLHEQLNTLFKFMNAKAPKGSEGHFNAEQSRELIDLRAEVYGLQNAVLNAGSSLSLDSVYGTALEGADEWLVPSGGSPIPAGFTPVELKWYDPIFWFGEIRQLKIANRETLELEKVGEGSFAIVSSFIDPMYDVKVAKKQLKTGLNQDARNRFKREFETMKTLSSPYVLEVYKYDDIEDSFVMEYCDYTLREYVEKRRADPKFNMYIRKRMAEQFCFGLQYLHMKKIYHRDLSYGNVLVKQYDLGAVQIKISDFGVVKHEVSDYTRTAATIIGTDIDPELTNFSDFQPVNDIWTVGRILNYIFTLTGTLAHAESDLGKIVHKCRHSDPSQRFQSMAEIIQAIQSLDYNSPTFMTV